MNTIKCPKCHTNDFLEFDMSFSNDIQDKHIKHREFDVTAKCSCGCYFVANWSE